MCSDISEKPTDSNPNVRDIGTLQQSRHFFQTTRYHRRSQWPRGLRHRTAAARLLRLWVRIQRRAWMFVCCECCVLSGRDLCDELITRPEESYRLCCVVVCDLETSWMRRPWPTLGCRAKNKHTNKQGIITHKPINVTVTTIKTSNLTSFSPTSIEVRHRTGSNVTIKVLIVRSDRLR